MRPSCRALQVGATAVRRISKERIHAFHNKHRGALHVEPEVQSSWSEVRTFLQKDFWLGMVMAAVLLPLNCRTKDIEQISELSLMSYPHCSW